MKKGNYITLVLILALGLSACAKDGDDTEGTQQVAEMETESTSRSAEQDAIWKDFIEHIYIQDDIDILTAGDSENFMEKVEASLSQKPDWENNVYYEQADGSSLMYNQYDSFQSYTVKSSEYDGRYDYTLTAFDESGKLSEIRTTIKSCEGLDERENLDQIDGFSGFIKKYSITSEAEFLQTLGVWSEGIEKAFQNETTEDYAEYFDTYYGKVRIAVRTQVMNIHAKTLESTVAISFAEDSESPYQTIYLSGESGYDNYDQTSGITVDAYIVTDSYRTYLATEKEKDASQVDTEEVWQLLADMENKSFATYSPWNQNWQDYKVVLEKGMNLTLINEEEYSIEKNRKISFMEECMGHDPFTFEEIPIGTEFKLSNENYYITANFDYFSDMFDSYVLHADEAYLLGSITEEDQEEMGGYLDFCNKYAVLDPKDFLETLGIETDYLDDMIAQARDSHTQTQGATTIQTPYGEATLKIDVEQRGDYADVNHKILELGELNLQTEAEATGDNSLYNGGESYIAFNPDGTVTWYVTDKNGNIVEQDDSTDVEDPKKYTDEELFEKLGCTEDTYITVAEPETMCDAITLIISFPEENNPPMKTIYFHMTNTNGLDGLKYGFWDLEVDYKNNSSIGFEV